MQRIRLKHSQIQHIGREVLLGTIRRAVIRWNGGKFFSSCFSLFAAAVVVEVVPLIELDVMDIGNLPVYGFGITERTNLTLIQHLYFHAFLISSLVYEYYEKSRD